MHKFKPTVPITSSLSLSVKRTNYPCSAMYLAIVSVDASPVEQTK